MDIAENQEKEQENLQPADYFCFSEVCRGTNYKTETTSKKCLREHADCVISDIDVIKQATRLKEEKKIHEHQYLKNKIEGLRIDLNEISRDLDSVFFIQYLPQMIKEDVIKVSAEFHNYFSFYNEDSCKELQFTAQFNIVDRMIERFSSVSQQANQLIEKINTIKEESLKEIDVLHFCDGDYQQIGKPSENGEKVIKLCYYKLTFQNFFNIKQQESGVCMKFKSNTFDKKKVVQPKKKPIKKQIKEQGGISITEKKKAQNVLRVQKKTENLRKKTQELQKKKNLNSQIEHSNLEDENGKMIEEDKKGTNQRKEENDLIVLDDDEYEEEQIGVPQFSENFQQSNLLLFNQQTELQISEQDQLKYQRQLRQMQEEHKKYKQIIYVSENQNAQDLNAYLFCFLDQEIQILKGKQKSEKDTFVSENQPEQPYTTVKKAQAHEFEKMLYLVKLQNNGHLTIQSIKNKQKEICGELDATITDFYSFIEVQEGIIYIITIKQQLYKIWSFNILSNKRSLKELYSKNLPDQNITNITHKTYISSSKDRIVNILLQTPKYLMIQEGINQLNEFSEFKKIYYTGYIYFTKLLNYNGQIYFAIVGVDNTISLYNQDYQIKRVITLQKNCDTLLDVVQIYDELLLLVERKGLSLYNLNQPQKFFFNPKQIADISDIQSVYMKDIFLYVLNRQYQHQQIKKYSISEFQKNFTYVKQEALKND